MTDPAEPVAPAPPDIDPTDPPEYWAAILNREDAVRHMGSGSGWAWV